MADHKIGTIFVELDLDPSRYMKGQQQLYRDATQTSLNIEKNFKNLGVKSSAEMDLMRAKITNSFNMIANSSKATAQDILRAEEAKNAKLRQLNEQQFGHQTTLLERMKKDWILAAAAVGGAASVLNSFIDSAAKAEVEEQKLSAALRSRGIASKEALEVMLEQSKAMQENSIFSDEQINTAKRFAISIGVLPSQLNDVMKAASQIAILYDKDLREATEAVSLAIEGNTRGFKRIDPVLASYLKTASSAEEIMRLLNERFGSDAVSQMDTYTGRVKKFQNQWDEFKEATGNFLLPMLKGILWYMTEIVKAPAKYMPGEFQPFGEDAPQKVAKDADAILKEADKVAKKLPKLSDSKIENKILKSLTQEYKNTYEQAIESAEHASKMMVLAGENELNFALETINKKQAALNTWYDDQASAINNHVRNEAEKQAKLQALDADYDKQWQKYADQKAEKTTQVIEFQKKAYSSYVTWEQKQNTNLLESARYIAGEREKISADTWDKMAEYQRLTGEKTSETNREILQQMIDDYENTFAGGWKAGLDDILNATKTWGDRMKSVMSTVTSELQSIEAAGLKAFIKGEDTKKAVKEATGNAIVNITAKYSMESFNKAIESTIEMIGAYIGEGAAVCGAEGSKEGGVYQALSEIGIYLATGVGAMLGGRALASQFYAGGGWVANHPYGGMINEGSRVNDDVYLGNTPGVRHWGMGGEFVVNKDAASKHLELLNMINADHADGGPVHESKMLGQAMRTGGEATFWKAYGDAGGGYQGIAAGIAATALYVGSGIGASFGGKMLAKAFHEDGGYIDVGHSFGSIMSSMGKVLDPFGITGKGMASISDVLSGVTDRFFGGNLGWDQIAKDILTPGVYMSNPLKVMETDLRNYLLKGSVMNPAGFLAELFSKNGGYIPSARNGLDYVPRDNFLINAHEGERLQTKKEADVSRAGGSTAPIYVPITLYLDNKVLYKGMYIASKAGTKIIHERGIADK